MNRFFIASACASVLFACSFPAHAADTAAGFVGTPLWFSEEKFEAGDTVRIYAGIWNGEDEGLSGTAQFYDKDVLLGKRSFAAAPGTLEAVAIEWKATAGEHAFSVKLVDTAFAGGRQAMLASSETPTKKMTVARPAVSLQTAGVIDVLESEAAEKAGERAGRQIEKAESFVVGVIPEPVMEVLGATFEPVEDFRKARIGTIEEKAERVRAEIDAHEAAKEEANDDAGSGASEPLSAEEGFEEAWNGPLKYAYYFFLKLLHFIYSHALAFYVVLAYLAYVALRFVFRVLRPRAA